MLLCNIKIVHATSIGFMKMQRNHVTILFYSEWVTNQNSIIFMSFKYGYHVSAGEKCRAK